MNSNFITMIGIIAGTLTTISLLPQLLKTLKTKSAKDLSSLMLIILCIGVILWITYGIIRKDTPLVLANSITLIIALIILVLKFQYERKEIE
jgi:MtN3 and saliva related transmembrane protein